MTRWKASGIHLFASLALALAVFLLLFYLWYPGALFRATGGEHLIVLLIAIDIVIGPLLTLIVFKPGKKHLTIDLAIIAVLQVAALVYGLHIILQARPAFIVFSVDRLVVVTANQLEDQDLAKAHRPEFKRRSWSGPRLAAAVPPQDPAKREMVLMSALNGKDLDRYPEFFEPYQDHRQHILAKAKPLAELGAKLDTETAERLARRGGKSLAYLPLMARDKGYVAVISTIDAKPVEILPISPW